MTPAAIVSLLVEVSWRSVLVAALVGGVLVIWRVKGGAVRHAAWTAVMVAMLLMPALLVFVPELPVPLPVAQFRESTPARLEVRPLQEPSAASAPNGVLPAPRTSPAAVPAQAQTSSAPPSFSWQQIAIGAWFAGFLINLAVMFMGWRLARRLMATAKVSEIDPRVMESPTVAAPCAVGLWRVQVLVPQAWRTWSRAGRDAVLQHELAHVSRRDLFVLFVARVNRAIFWFHPVAWWLERRIAASAEQACDEAVLQAGQDPQRYASVLLEMANALRTSGTRVAWQSLGMAEGTDLESRIDRVLTGEVPRLSRGRIAGVMTMSAVAMVIAVACTQAPPKLAVNPEITARMERDVESRSASAAARSMSADEVRTLTDQVIANPDDRALVDKLVRFYSAQRDIRPGTVFVPSPEFLESHRRVVLWSIEHKPTFQLAQWRVPRAADPGGYDAAQGLWAKRLASKDVTISDYEQGIWFTLLSDPVSAERMVMEARRRFPRAIKADGTLGGSLERNWSNHLGAVYASVMLGAYEYPPFFFGRANSVLAASPEAKRVRAIVDASTDAFLVGAVGDGLAGTRHPADRPLHFDADALGREYLRRSLELDSVHPAQVIRRASLESKEFQALLNSQAEKVRIATGARLEQLTPQQVMALPEDLQWTTLPHVAGRAQSRAMSRGFQNSGDSEWREQLRLAREYSDRAIVLLQRRSDPNIARLRHKAHAVRGFAAIADNDRTLAITHMNAAIAAVAEQPTLFLNGEGWDHTLTNYLIKAGDTTAVAEAFERLASIVVHDTGEFKKSAADLRAGRMPDQYQRMIAWLEEQKRY